ncbi:MAG: hypothetical protein ACPL4H_02155, partial [Anaerolineales bacterium]
GAMLQLTSPHNQVLIDLNANTFSQDAAIKLYSLSDPFGSLDWRKWITGFLFHAEVPDNESADPLNAFSSPATVTMSYQDSSFSSEDEAFVKLFYWDEENQHWIDAATTCSPNSSQQLDTVKNQVVTAICLSGEYGLLVDKPPKVTYLPLINSNSSENSLSLESPASISSAEPNDITTPLATCSQLITNGNFEKNAGWLIHGSIRPAIYTTAKSLNGVRSMRSGIVDAAYNAKSYSVFSQDVNIPAGASSVTLTFYLYQRSSESTATSSAGSPVQGIQSIDAPGKDINYVGLYDLNNNLVADPLVWERSNARIWTGYAFNLLGFSGKQLRIKFGTYNDGLDGVTAMYVDAVSLIVCPSIVTTPLVQNGGFENTSGWVRLNSPIPPVYTSVRSHSGKQSMLAGVTQNGSTAKGYSIFEQMVSIPSTITSASLQFYWWAQSGESNLNTLPAQLSTDTNLAGSDPNDLQYVAIMDLNHHVLAYPLWRRSNNRSWEASSFDLTPYKGQTIILRFGVYNDGDGDVTAMYVDDVSITTTP